MTTVSGVSATTPQSAYGLDFKSLLQIILQQLTYQDPLKPMDNFQFVSQLAQFSQLQQTQTLNTSITSLLTAQSSTQAIGLLGKKVDFLQTGATIPTPDALVTSVTFASGTPSLTVHFGTGDGQTVAGVALSAVTQIKQGS